MALIQIHFWLTSSIWKHYAYVATPSDNISRFLWMERDCEQSMLKFNSSEVQHASSLNLAGGLV